MNVIYFLLALWFIAQTILLMANKIKLSKTTMILLSVIVAIHFYEKIKDEEWIINIYSH